ncbi:MAG: peptide/nickel transport system substrate-binding protein [Solirubrobacterales bacterium]|nr:peptide/nickel transport system substrate-binding protein [Solirubrobacterales bacterium]
MTLRGLRLTLSVAIAATLAPAGCGSSVSGPVGAAGALPAPSGTLVIALPGRPGTLDPLLAATSSQELLARQLYEPLAETLTGPYDDLRRVAGPARSVRGSSNAEIWRVRLRPGIKFQDGSRLDAAAVLANAVRWRATPAGRALLPGLTAADSPRPDLVRFFLDRSDPRFRARLASPRLGLVSPNALASAGGPGGGRAGSGPFELRQRSAGQVVIARNASWWGTGRRLGPALDTVELDYVPGAAARAKLVRTGQAQIATALTSTLAASLARDPLISVRGHGTTGFTALERSVRGVGFAGRAPALSGAWLTTIGAG